MPEVLDAAPEAAPAETNSTPEAAKMAGVGPAAKPEKETPAPAPDAEASARKLEKTVREKLDALSADDDEPDAPESEAEQAEDAVASPEGEAKPEEAAAEVTPAPTLPAAHVRSLKAFGLTDEEVAKTSPEVAAALHSRRNQEITRWAERGRAANSVPAPAAPAAPAPTPPAPTAVVDIAALKQQYGDEPLIHALEAQAREIAEFREFRQRANQEIQQRQLETLGKQIDGFFAAKEMAPYYATYGTEAATATVEQFAKREEVLKLASAIVDGARTEGMNLNLDQALQHAFDSISAPIQKQVARQEITKELKQRAKGLTLKPGGRAVLPKANSRREMETAVRSKLKEVFAD